MAVFAGAEETENWITLIFIVLASMYNKWKRCGEKGEKCCKPMAYVVN